jgi:hypothetical protein
MIANYISKARVFRRFDGICLHRFPAFIGAPGVCAFCSTLIPQINHLSILTILLHGPFDCFPIASSVYV